MKTFIVKVQAPLESNEEDAPFQIYNQDRTVEVQFPSSAVPDLWLALRDRPKAYFEAMIDGTGKLHLVKEAEAQPW